MMLINFDWSSALRDGSDRQQFLLPSRAILSLSLYTSHFPRLFSEWAFTPFSTPPQEGIHKSPCYILNRARQTGRAIEHVAVICAFYYVFNICCSKSLME